MRVFQATFILLATIVSACPVLAQTETETETDTRRAPNANVLKEDKWKQLDVSVERGLKWLATQQQENGSFESIDQGQPAVTSFCLMAFLAQGESPVDGKYQQRLTKAIDFIADQQKPNGLLAANAPASVPISREMEDSESTATEGQPKPNEVGTTAVYNHAISALALCEAYGQCDAAQTKRLAPVIEKAIAATLEMQRWPGKQKQNIGGWRYLTLRLPRNDADLSVTGWQLMFLRSAKNAGFDVPKESIDAAVKYVENCYLKGNKVHGYYAPEPLSPRTYPRTCSRATAGAGILALAHAGQHDSEEAVTAGEWVLKHDFSNYDVETAAYGVQWLGDRYHYGAILCTQGMYQLGGKYWEQFFPTLVDAVLANQEDDGSWLTKGRDAPYGSCYSTSLCILSLSVPNQMLPIFQR